MTKTEIIDTIVNSGGTVKEFNDIGGYIASYNGKRSFIPNRDNISDELVSQIFKSLNIN